MTSEHEYNANNLSNNTIVRTAHISIIESLRVGIIQVVYVRTCLGRYPKYHRFVRLSSDLLHSMTLGCAQTCIAGGKLTSAIGNMDEG